MICVSGLREQLTGGVVEAPPDAMKPSEQLAAIRKELTIHLRQQSDCWQTDLLPKLREKYIKVFHYRELQVKQRKLLNRYFAREIFPTLTPLAFDPAHPFPHISNLSLNLAVVVKDPERGECFARLKIPGVFPRLIRIPNEERVEECEQLGLADVDGTNFVWIEEVVAANLNLLFPGLDVVAAYTFRVTRDADLEIEEDEASDLIESVEEQVDLRHFGSAVRLEIDKATPEHIREILSRNLSLAPYQVYTTEGPIGMADVMELTRIDRPDLKDTPFVPVVSGALAKKESLFSVIRREDVLLYHPFDSFAPVIDFLREAVSDPHVLAIKQTLYRVGLNSPIVEALTEARENGKQVSVLVELKARFDEENNIEWARKLEDEGVHVVYGVIGLKTHAKMCLVVRHEENTVRRYVHLGTGNYNHVTTRIYTDFGFFTCRPEIGADVADLFNALTGYSRKDSYTKLLVAPNTLRQQILQRIEREIARHQEHGDGYIAFKMNALADKPCIQALYKASQAGVKIDLHIRGICCLRPGIPMVSDSITVTSIVGRFLEHARIFYFRNGGEEEIFLGSSDLMPRNLDRRVELLFPVEDPTLRELIVNVVLRSYQSDNSHARRLRSDGTYERLYATNEECELNAQDWFMHHWKDKEKVGEIGRLF